jgi:hypothetical protein
MKKEIYIYLLLLSAICTSVYIEVRQIVNLENLTETITFSQYLDAKQEELSDFIAIKNNHIANSNTAELVFGVAIELRNSNIFVNIACKWIDDKSMQLPVPFTFAQKLHYEFKVCDSFQYCACNVTEDGLNNDISVAMLQ